MTRVLAPAAGLGLALLLALAPAAPRAAERGERADTAKALEVLRLLADEDVVRARAVAEPLLAAKPDAPAAKLAAGVLRFYEQRYDDSVALLEASRSGDAGGYLGLAKAARDVTKGHARFESEHFAISYPAGKDEVLSPYLVDALERQRAALSEALGVAPEGRLAIELVSDVKELARLTTLTEAEIRTSGTVAVCKFNKLMILSPKALLKGYDWLDTAAHEYTHLVLTLKSENRAPIWLQEGLAKWYEDEWRGGGEPLSPFDAASLRDAAEKNALVTFDEMHPSMAKLPSQEKASLAYAEVVLAIEQLVKQAGPKGPARVLDLVAGGKDAGEAVAAVVGKPFDRFLAEWRAWLAARPLPRGGEHALRKLRFKDDPKHGGSWSEWSEIADDRARGFARLGELLRARGRPLAARLEYAKAWDRVGARYPILADQYALVAMASGAEGTAETVLGDAIAFSPEYAALHVHLARLLVRRQEWAKARDHLLLANRQDPFDPEIHAGLARALAALSDPGGASREERFARILSPEDKR